MASKKSGGGSYQTGQNAKKGDFWNGGKQNQLGGVINKRPLVDGEKKGTDQIGGLR